MTVLAKIIEKAAQIAAGGSSAFLALSLGTAPDEANRIGIFADTTASAEQLVIVVGAQTGPAFLRSGSSVIATSMKLQDSTCQIVGSSDTTKSLAFQVDTQGSGFQLTIDVGAQAANRTLSVPVLGGNRTLAVIDQAQTFTVAQTFSSTVTISGLLTNTYSDNAYGLALIRNTNAGTAAQAGLVIQNDTGVDFNFFLTSSTYSGFVTNAIGAGGSVTRATWYLANNGVANRYLDVDQTTGTASSGSVYKWAFANVTEATSKDAASVVLEGGLAVEKRIYTGSSAFFGGKITQTPTGYTTDYSGNIITNSQGDDAAFFCHQGTSTNATFAWLIANTTGIYSPYNGNRIRLGFGVTATKYFEVTSTGVTIASDLTSGLTISPTTGTTLTVSSADTNAAISTAGGITIADAKNILVGSTTGTKIATSSAQKLGIWNATPIVQPSAYTQTFATAARTVNSYTSDAESGAYTGLDNAQGGTPYARLTDLNALRIAYENLRAMVENMQQVVNSLIDDHQAIGLCA